ncbi:hypothetical protein JRO89_XS09G0212900 [Xanthoceras sorbifolium]|uniref:Ankyrin repeat protein n=1 Tax=Xanthoceras sorbifolium TaxID=99658 RepID=A0ABQ8HMI5_9ROSI|nr:hypothetical protein JRO89_XS09G0212900 [Xanthoceras sorbifolium]
MTYILTGGGVQPSVNPSLQPNPENVASHGNSEEPHSFQAQHIPGELLNHYRPLFNAAQSGNWESAKSFIDNDPNGLTARITAVKSLAAGDTKGMTVLHYVAYGGSLKTAKALVRKNPNLPQIVNIVGQLPLYCSIFNGSKEMVWYFTSITKVDLPASLLNILHSLIIPGYFGKN